MRNKRKKLSKIAMSGFLFLSLFSMTGCNDSTKKEKTKEQEVKDVTYELWQEGTGALPDREVLDKQGMDYAIKADIYEKDENGNWKLVMKGLTIYTGDPMYNGIEIGEAHLREETPPLKALKRVFKKWIIIPVKYEVIDGVERRFVSTTQEGYELGTFDTETPSLEELKTLS